MSIGAQAMMVGDKMDSQRPGAYPQRWSEMSIDFKLMFALHGAAMVQFMLGGSLTTAIEATVQSVLIAGAILFATLSRRQCGWHWSGAGPKQYMRAVLSVSVILLFLGAATPLAPPTNPQIFPWYLAGLQIGLFNTLNSLRIVRMANADFLADCKPDPPTIKSATTESIEPGWRSWTRRAYSAAFLAIWLEWVAFFYFHGVTFRDGAPLPNANMNSAMTEHGHTVYVTAASLGRDQLLMTIGTVGIPVIIILGAILHFVFRIRIYGNEPSADHFEGSRRQ